MTDKELKIQIEQELIEMTKNFCMEFINEEYACLCEKLIKKIGKKRDVPFIRGRKEIWASAIIQTIGRVNFLYDKSFEPYLSNNDINNHWGTKSSTIGSKVREIEDLLNITVFDPEFSTVSVSKSNPLNKLMMVNGFIVPIKEFSEEFDLIEEIEIPENKKEIKEKINEPDESDIFLKENNLSLF